MFTCLGLGHTYAVSLSVNTTADERLAGFNLKAGEVIEPLTRAIEQFAH